MPFEFVLFGLTLAGVAIFPHHPLAVALSGLAAMIGGAMAHTLFKTVHFGYLMGWEPHDPYRPASPRPVEAGAP